MRFMILISGPGDEWPPAVATPFAAWARALFGDRLAGGELVDAALLAPSASATTVRVRDGRVQVAAGPWSREAEPVAAYCLIEVANRDEAVACAVRLQEATQAVVEVRPVFLLEGLPAESLAATHRSDMTKFIFLCYDDEDAWSRAGAEAHREAMLEAVALTHRLDERGQYLAASPLQPTATASRMQTRDGRPFVTVGPFTETREVLGGYYLILAADQEEAVGYAARHSGARVGAVEVRQVLPSSCPGST